METGPTMIAIGPLAREFQGLAAAAEAGVVSAREFRRVLEELGPLDARRAPRERRRARYEIREAILARRLGIAPAPWRSQ
jgi:hypothetical protein